MSGSDNLDSGGGSTGSTDFSSLASGFVDSSGNVYWLGVARTLISSLIFVATAGAIWFWEAVWMQFNRLVRGTTEWMYQLASRPWNLAAGHFYTAWETAGAQFPIAGPLDYALAVMLIAATFWVTAILFRRVVMGVFG